MDIHIISLKTILISISISLMIVFGMVLRSYLDDKPKIVFCNVGQGDAAYIRTSDHVDILIDAGPGNSVVGCVSKYMPIYDRRIEYLFLSHPQYDHYGGFLDILKRYKINFFIKEPISNNEAHTYNDMEKLISNHKIFLQPLYEDDILNIDSAQIISFWPSRNYLQDHSENMRPLVDLNNFSEGFIYKDLNISVLFTGDMGPDIENFILTEQRDLHANILKVPHHGSSNGLTTSFLKAVNPDLSVISVGQNNTFGHPSKEIIALLNKLHKKYLRTDEKGDIVIDYDENGWRIR